MQIRRLGCQPSRVRLDATRPCSARSLCAFACVQFMCGENRRCVRCRASCGAAVRVAECRAHGHPRRPMRERVPHHREGPCVCVMHKWGCAPGSRDTRVCVFCVRLYGRMCMWSM
jgi:hypothetical protein